MLRDQKSIGELIKYYRIIHGISQSELALKLHVTVSAVSNWERGLSRPSVDVALVLAEDMHMTLDEFYTTQTSKISETRCNVTDEIKLFRLYFKLKNYVVHLSENTLEMVYQIKGLAITEKALLEQLNVYITTQGRKVLPSLLKLKAIHQLPEPSSPELDEFPLRAHAFELKLLFDFNGDHPLEIHLEMADEKRVIPISKDFNHLILHGISPSPKNLKQNKRLIEKPEFQCYLTYMMEKYGMEKIQQLFLEQLDNLDSKKND